MADTKPHAKSKIDSIKSVIKRRGVSRGNLFEIDLGGLYSTLSVASENEVRDLEILITKATLPTRNLITFEHGIYRNDTSFVSGYVNSGFTADFTLTEDYLAKKVFNRWLNRVISKTRYTVNYKSTYTCDIGIKQLKRDEENTVIYEAKLENCFPKGISEISLDSGPAGLPTVSVEFLYDDIEFKEYDSNMVNI